MSWLITESNMWSVFWLLFWKLLDYFAQSSEWKVNVSKFIHMRNLHFLFLIYLFRPCEISEVKFCSFDHPFIINLVSFNKKLKDRMRSRTRNVHPCASFHSVLFSSFKKKHAIIHIRYHIFSESINIDSRILVFPNVKRVLMLYILQEIIKFFIINLQEGTENSTFNILFLNLRKNSLNNSRSETQEVFLIIFSVRIKIIWLRTEHRECFPTTGLSIRENGTIKSLNNLLWGFFDKLIEVFLSILGKEDGIIFALEIVFHIWNVNLFRDWTARDDDFLAKFSVDHGSNSNCDLQFLSFLRLFGLGFGIFRLQLGLKIYFLVLRLALFQTGFQGLRSRVR